MDAIGEALKGLTADKKKQTIKPGKKGGFLSRPLLCYIFELL